MTKLILVEGLPGSGKSTKSREIQHKLLNSGYKVCYLKEHDILNKIDITRKAFLSYDEYKRMLNQCNNIVLETKCKYDFEDIKQKVEKYTNLYNDMYVVSYSQIEFDDINLNKVISSLYKKEKCNGNCTFDEYKKIMYDLWNRFVKDLDENTIYIIDGGFLHNPLFDIIAHYNLSENDIYDFYEGLNNIIKSIDLKMIYIDMDSIENTIKSRRSKTWLNQFSKWIENSNYGKIRNLSETNEIVEFCKLKMNIEKKIIEHLNIDCEVSSCKEVKKCQI